MDVEKRIAESKLKAFTVGNMGKKKISRKELEEQKKKQEEEEAAQVFEEFVATFQEIPTKQGQIWIKAGTYNAGTREEDKKDQGKLYKPAPKLLESSEKYDKSTENHLDKKTDKPERPGRKKEKEKKKSNLELFKEELKLIQEEREERQKVKKFIKEGIKITRFEPPDVVVRPLPDDTKGNWGSFDNGDPSTTNLYLGNLNPKITEQQLMELFGHFGPLASIKIMWPRSEEEKARGRNCGFVAFMNRKDGERALNALSGWGKAVPLPPQPIYIPPAMLDISLPPPPSGLPFNAQPESKDKHKIPPPGTVLPFGFDAKEYNEALAAIMACFPFRNLLCLIHRMIEFVVREGPMFEAMIMNREINNPMYRFLFDNQSTAHVYYRWKLFSILQGDTPYKWRTDDIRMFKDGSIWRPPLMNPYVQGMPEDLVEKPNEAPKRGMLSNAQRDRLEDMLRTVTLERNKIAEVMVFCIDHAEAAEEICDCIAESLSILQTPLPKKIARLYLVSDILHNCSAKVRNASFYRKGFQNKVIQIFEDLHESYRGIESRIKAEHMKQRVMRCFRAWEDWAIYPADFLLRLQNIFLGVVQPAKINQKSEINEEVDGTPMSDASEQAIDENDLDGVPLDGAALLKNASSKLTTEDLDGLPISANIDGVALETSINEHKIKFAPSKWETVDPSLVEAQAITTSKWDLLEQEFEPPPPTDPYALRNADALIDDDIDGIPMEDDEQEVNVDHNEQFKQENPVQDRVDSHEFSSKELPEDHRLKLREVEVKVMTYMDELESGGRTLKSGYTIQQQVEHYRKKLLKKMDKEGKKNTDKKIKSPEAVERFSKSHSRSPRKRSPIRKKSPKRSHRSRSRSRSPKRKRSSSRSPRRHSRSRSVGRRHKKKRKH